MSEVDSPNLFGRRFLCVLWTGKLFRPSSLFSLSYNGRLLKGSAECAFNVAVLHTHWRPVLSIGANRSDSHAILGGRVGRRQNAQSFNGLANEWRNSNKKREATYDGHWVLYGFPSADRPRQVLSWPGSFFTESMRSTFILHAVNKKKNVWKSSYSVDESESVEFKNSNNRVGLNVPDLATGKGSRKEERSANEYRRMMTWSRRRVGGRHTPFRHLRLDFDSLIVLFVFFFYFFLRPWYQIVLMYWSPVYYPTDRPTTRWVLQHWVHRVTSSCVVTAVQVTNCDDCTMPDYGSSVAYSRVDRTRTNAEVDQILCIAVGLPPSLSTRTNNQNNTIGAIRIGSDFHKTIQSCLCSWRACVYSPLTLPTGNRIVFPPQMRFLALLSDSLPVRLLNHGTQYHFVVKVISIL